MDDAQRAEGPPPSPDPAGSPTPGRLPLLLVAVAAAVVAVDQVTKVLVVASLTPGVPVPVVDGVLQLRLIRNPGAAFSMATGSTWIFTVVAVVVAAVILRMSRRLGSAWWAVALGLLMGGAVGNLVDRLVREPGVGRGHVVDFIEFLRFPVIDFPVFNVADSCIVTAAGCIVVLGLLGIGLDGSRAPSGGATPQQRPAADDRDRAEAPRNAGTSGPADPGGPARGADAGDGEVPGA